MITSGTSLAKELVNTQIIHENVWQVQKMPPLLGAAKCEAQLGDLRHRELVDYPKDILLQGIYDNVGQLQKMPLSNDVWQSHLLWRLFEYENLQP